MSSISCRRRIHDKNQAGFTLIELLVVIIILGILSAVVVFAVRGAGDKGQVAAQQTDVKTVRTAQEAFCARKGFYAKTEQELVNEKLLSEVGTLSSIQTDGVSGTCGDGALGPNGYNILCNITSNNDCKAAVANGAVAAGGTMVLPASNLSGPYNPATTSSGNSHPLGEAMFNGLLAFDKSGAVVPDLASALPTTVNNPDGTQDVSFTLRDGLVWHDNTAANPQPITNADVFFSFTQGILRAGRTASSMGPALGFSSSTATFSQPAGGAINLFNVGGKPLGVTFHFLYPYSPLIRQMNVTEAPLIPQHVYAHCALANGGGTAPWTDTLRLQTAGSCPESFAPIGSGPFTWGGLNTGSTVLTLNKNNQYFKPGLPLLNKVVIQVTGNSATALSSARGSSGSIDTAGISATALTAPFNFTTSPSYSIATVPRGSGGSACIDTISFNLWQPAGPLPEFAAGDPGLTNGLPGSSVGKDQAAVAILPANTPYDNPILSSNLVRKALFEGFDRGLAAVKNTGVATAVGAAPGTARMADSIYNSTLTGVYSPTTLPGGTGANLGKPDIAQANADLNAAGWDGPRVTDSNGVPNVRTWSGNVPSSFGLAVGTHLKLDISHFQGSTTPVIATQFVSDMKVIGVDVVDRNNLVSPAWPAVVAARNFEIGIVSYCNGDDPVIGVQRQYVSSAIPVAFAANTSGYRDQGASPGDGSMDGLWYQANRATTAAQRTSIYAQIQALAVSTNTQIPVSESVTNRVTRAACQGLNNQNTGLFVETAYCSG